nr:zf-TFIIB domain-containing protein [Lentzea kentuckyensis]
MGVHIEQCDGCRGVFLDYGELESITRLEAQRQAAPGRAAARRLPAAGPARLGRRTTADPPPPRRPRGLRLRPPQAPRPRRSLLLLVTS